MSAPMEYRTLGRSGLRVSVLSLGTMTFGGRGAFGLVGDVGVDEARRQVDLCLDAGVNLVDTADIYSAGVSEEIVGEVLVGRRDDVLVATKARFPMGRGPNDAGLSRQHLVRVRGEPAAVADGRSSSVHAGRSSWSTISPRRGCDSPTPRSSGWSR
jgi:hypothetical protein